MYLYLKNNNIIISMDQIEIKEMIKKYISIDDEITEVNKIIKEKRKTKTELEDSIKQYMVDNGLSTITTGKDHLKIKNTKQNKSVSKKNIISGLLEILEKQQVDNIVGHIFENDEDLPEVVKVQRIKKI